MLTGGLLAPSLLVLATVINQYPLSPFGPPFVGVLAGLIGYGLGKVRPDRE